MMLPILIIFVGDSSNSSGGGIVYCFKFDKMSHKRKHVFFFLEHKTILQVSAPLLEWTGV